MEASEKTKLGRLLINTEIYPRMERAYVTPDSARESRIGQMKISGQERKNHMSDYYEETEAGEVELAHWE